jgi:threonine synthase
MRGMNTIRYISTRGRTAPMGFQDAVMTGLAPDGGLLIPERIPDVRDRLAAWAGLDYRELAFEILRLYADLPEEDLRSLIERSYAAFRHPQVTPTVAVGKVHIVELFHGPTLAFKDVALQLLGNLFEYILERRDQHLNILAATSGDTGSAAIYGVRGQERIHIFVMHPKGRVSAVQERQMTSVLDHNVYNLAVEGTFDDCQRIMKSIFRDVDFKQRYALGAVNSVNWARVLAQMVYYFYTALRLIRSDGPSGVQFAVPTGNFGDILAGWYAKQMGLPISRLILATNENDILSRFFNTGTYSLGEVVPTISPSMDIQVASNFERYLYYRLDRDSAKLRELMEGFERSGSLTLPRSGERAVDPLFVAEATDQAATIDTIRRCWQDYGYLLDPHSATGVHAAELHPSDQAPSLCLATAHPAKFGDAILRATGEDLAHHEILDSLADAETRCADIAADEQAIRDYVAQHAL